MKQFERVQQTTYRFWRDDEKDIEPQHVSELEAHAKSHINEMVGKGFTSGELQITLYMNVRSDSLYLTEVEVDYSGNWEIKEVK